MHPGADLRSFLVGALLLGFVQLVGCAAARGQPTGVATVQVLDVLKQADEAYKNETYEHALELYSALLESPQKLPEEQAQVVRERIAVLNSILRERTLAARREHLAGLLAEATVLVSEQRYEEAAAKMAGLGAGQELSEGERRELQELQVAVARATGRLPGMTEKEAKALANEYLKRALEAYRAKDYAAADALFERAAVLEKHLDDRGRDILRRRRGIVTAELARLHAVCAEAKQLYTEQDYARAAELFQKVSDSGISIGAEQDQEVAKLLQESKERLAEQRQREEQRKRTRVADLLAEATALVSQQRPVMAEAILGEIERLAQELGEQGLSEQQQRELLQVRVAVQQALERQKKEHLAGLLAEAKGLVSEQKYEEAEAKLVELMGLSQELDEQQQGQLQELRAAVERATGRLPGMTEEEAKALANDYLKRALEVYNAKDYAAAEGLFERAAALEKHLDDSARTGLHEAHAEVTRSLAELRAACREGKRFYAQQDYARASELFQKVADSGIRIGAEQDQEVASLLRGSKERLAEQRQRAAGLMAEVKALVSEGRYRETQAKLTELAGLAHVLDENEQRELQQLRTAFEQARNRPASLLAEARALIAEQKYDEAAAKLAELEALARGLSAQQQRELLELRVAVQQALERQKKERLAGLLAEAKDLVARQRHKEADARLAELEASAQELSQQQQREVRRLRAAIEQARARLAGLLEEAKDLILEERCDEAEAKLAELEAVARELNEQQQGELQQLRIALEQTKKRLAMLTLTSPAFEPGQMIPVEYTGDGEDLSPPLAWDNVPEGTASFALVMDDPDVPLFTFTHWLICDIPATARALPQGIPKRENVGTPVKAVQGANGFRKVGYGGPMPPKGETHRYVFTLYALDAALDLPGGLNRSQLREAMRGHVLGQATLTGRYGR